MLMRSSLLMAMVLLIIVGSIIAGVLWLDRESDAIDFANEAINASNAYVDRNPGFFRPASYGARTLFGFDDPYCAYDVLFHELRFGDVELAEECVEPRAIRLAGTLVGGSEQMRLFETDLNSYAALEPYSILATYAFASEDEAARFASEMHEEVLDVYDTYYALFGSLDMPRYLATPPSLEFVGYERAVAPFIGYEGEVGIFHIAIFRKDTFVFVHKVHSSEHRITIVY